MGQEAAEMTAAVVAFITFYSVIGIYILASGLHGYWLRWREMK